MGVACPCIYNQWLAWKKTIKINYNPDEQVHLLMPGI
jgi:hypothetical protein